jgi:hypothetical protein
MTFGEIEKLCRKEVSDEVGDDTSYRVKSWQMLAYANDAEDEACRRAKLLVDSTTAEVCNISLVSGTSVYALDPRIVFVKRAKVASRQVPLYKALYTDLDEREFGWEEKTGVVEAIVTGMETDKVRLYRIPSGADTLKMSVVRLPLNPMVNETSTPEINRRFHTMLVLWMKHRIFNNQDSELFDKNRADTHLALFEQVFGPQLPAGNEVFGELLAPGIYHESDYY